MGNICFYVLLCCLVVFVLYMPLDLLSLRPKHPYPLRIRDSVNKTNLRYNIESSSTHKHQPRIFYFVVTHPTSAKHEAAARSTWARTLPHITWYNTEPNGLPGTEVVSYKQNRYSQMGGRMVKVWSRVWQDHGATADFFVRLWPDNYVFASRLREVILSLNKSIPMVVGRAKGNGGRFNMKTKKGKFVKGGAGWVVTRATLQAWADVSGPDFASCTMTQFCPECDSFMEDVLISRCMKSAGAQLRHHPGFLSYSYLDRRYNLTIEKTVRGVPPRGKHVPVVTMHYVRPAQMKKLFRAQQRLQPLAVEVERQKFVGVR